MNNNIKKIRCKCHCKRISENQYHFYIDIYRTFDPQEKPFNFHVLDLTKDKLTNRLWKIENPGDFILEMCPEILDRKNPNRWSLESEIWAHIKENVFKGPKSEKAREHLINKASRIQKLNE